MYSRSAGELLQRISDTGIFDDAIANALHDAIKNFKANSAW